MNNPQEVVRFNTWWNKNLATVVNYDGSYWVFLVVYEPAQRNINEVLKVFPVSRSYQGKYGIYSRKRAKHSYLSDAQSEANWLRTILDDENPILVIHPYANEYKNFDWIVDGNYVKEYSNLPWNSSDWDNYIKPLSVIKVEKKHKTYGFAKFQHVGVYLGNNKVCHIYDYDEEKWMEAKITEMDKFLGNTSTTERCGKMEAYKPIIPFKNYEKIIKQISWAENRGYWKGDYDLFNRNCEHLANMLVYGINFSEQIAKLEKDGKGFWTKYWKDKNIFVQLVVKPWWWSAIIDTIKAGSKPSNNNKGQTIYLRNEINETNNKLGESTSGWYSTLENRIEIPHKQECKVM